MQYSTNLNMNKPDRSDQYNLEHWNENTDILDTQIQNIKTLTDVTLKTALLNFCYPIGSLYWSSNLTDPSTLFGGTWTQIKNKFIYAQGDKPVNTTGGADSTVLTDYQIPSHSHAYTPYGRISNHSHTFTPTGTVSVDSKTLKGSASESYISGVYSTRTGIITLETSVSSTALNDVGSAQVSSYKKLSIDATHDHTATFNGTEGTTNSVQLTFVGTRNYTENQHTHVTEPIDIMPPYIVKYCWERTA